jgi:hypothetical protein
MSIPKEPRQLMINLMYLVLTALLALNVSAEVMNAFFSLDTGVCWAAGKLLKNPMRDGYRKHQPAVAEAYNKPENEKYKNNAMEAQVYLTGFREIHRWRSFQTV